MGIVPFQANSDHTLLFPTNGNSSMMDVQSYEVVWWWQNYPHLHVHDHFMVPDSNARCWGNLYITLKSVCIECGIKSTFGICVDYIKDTFPVL
jgi:hypothetical protein